MNTIHYQTILIEGIPIYIYRDDLNHKVVSGNKLHKLSPFMNMAIEKNCSSVLSFGGPYSNHLHALAWISKQNRLNSIGIVRGELHSELTPTLWDCQQWGMQLIPCERQDYRRYQTLVSQFSKPRFAKQIEQPLFTKVPEDTLVIPEGGSNLMAIESLCHAYKPVFALPQHKQITHAICTTGTGATVAGLYKASPQNIEVVGIQAVSEGGATLERITKWIDEKPKRLKIQPGHLGGFGKIPAALKQFMTKFEATYNIPLDPIYNGKAMLKITEMIKTGRFNMGDQILYIHTGGLQGKRTKTD